MNLENLKINKEELEQLKQIEGNMKKYLKTLNKNAIIRHTIEQFRLFLAQRETNIILLEEIKRLSQYEPKSAEAEKEQKND